MSASIQTTGEDLTILSLSELTRVINVPISRLNKAVAEGHVRPCGTIGKCSIVALTKDEVIALRTQLHAPES
jgi:hypothetical protein